MIELNNEIGVYGRVFILFFYLAIFIGSIHFLIIYDVTLSFSLFITRTD